MTYMIHIYLVSFFYSVIYLFVTLLLSRFTFISSYRKRSEDASKRLYLVCDLRPLFHVLGTHVIAGLRYLLLFYVILFLYCFFVSLIAF